MEIMAFRNRYYGDYKCSGSGEILSGLCYCVGREDDDEGYEWRAFTEQFWNENIAGKMSIEEVYEKFPVAGYAD